MFAHEYDRDDERPDYAYSRLVETKETDANSLRKKADEGIVELPLPKEITHLLSSDDYAELLSSALGPADIMLTWGPRYAGVFDTILSGSSSMGPFIEATSQHLALAILVYLAIGASSAINFYLSYQGKKAAHQEKVNTYRKIRRKFKFEVDPEREEKDDDLDAEDEKINIENYNANLNRLITEMNLALESTLASSNKYEKIKICCPTPSTSEKIQLSDIKIECTFKKKALTPKEIAKNKKPQLVDEVEKPGIFRKFINKVISPLYTSMSLSSYVYWIFWIGASLAVGNFADAGIAGVTAWLGFGAPIAAGVAYSAIKIKNWGKNKGHISDEHARLTKIANEDTPQLLMEALRQSEFNAEVKRIKDTNDNLARELSEMHLEYKPTDISTNNISVPSDDSLLANPKTKAAAQLYTSIVSNYGMSQFNAWLISDFLKVSTTIAFAIPFFGEIMGGVLIGLGVGLGAYETYKKYKENVKEKAQQNGPAVNLEEVFENKKKELEALKHTRDEKLEKLLELEPYRLEAKQSPLKLSKILERPVPTPPSSMSLPRKIYNFFDWTATGIFFARIFFTAGSAIFLPFVAAALSNPVTIGILAVSGAIYLGLKTYQAYQKAKETHAKELVNKIQDMDEQIKVAKMTEQTLDMKKQTLQAKSGVVLQPAKVLEMPTLPRKATSSPIAIPKADKYRPKTQKKSYGLFGNSTRKDRLSEPLLSATSVEESDSSPVLA